MLKEKNIVVAMPAYNEAEAIEEVVSDFLSMDMIEEVVVVDNNSDDGTAELADEAGAEVVKEGRQGYGFACRKALDEATDRGDIAVLVESDGTFVARDLRKLLVYQEDFDMVLGSRTSRKMIWEGANMNPFLRWGNWFVAKVLEITHNTSSLTDVGCTFRAIDSEAYQEISDELEVGGSHFSPEMIIRAAENGISTIEVPVNYRERRGESKITGETWDAFKLGIVMLIFVLKERIKS